MSTHVEKRVRRKRIDGTVYETTYRLVKRCIDSPEEWWAIIKVATDGAPLQNKWHGYLPTHTGTPKYIKRIWEGLA